MKRIHLFEFEDQPWFPDWLRQCTTRLINVMHKLLGTKEDLAALLAGLLPYARQNRIIDLGSGSGGPMPNVYHILKNDHQITDLTLTLTDLYPNRQLAAQINNGEDINITYTTEPVDATNMDGGKVGVRTMVGGFHHMSPEQARQILKDARDNRQPICIFELSDNSFPIALWWISLPIQFLMTLFITPFARPMTWQQLVFTYPVPVIPFCFAWDGAVSNARTYTLSDMDILLEGLETHDYRWEKGTIGRKAKKLYLSGWPVS